MPVNAMQPEAQNNLEEGLPSGDLQERDDAEGTEEAFLLWNNMMCSCNNNYKPDMFTWGPFLFLFSLTCISFY